MKMQAVQARGGDVVGSTARVSRWPISSPKMCLSLEAQARLDTTRLWPEISGGSIALALSPFAGPRRFRKKGGYGSSPRSRT